MCGIMAGHNFFIILIFVMSFPFEFLGFIFLMILWISEIVAIFIENSFLHFETKLCKISSGEMLLFIGKDSLIFFIFSIKKLFAIFTICLIDVIKLPSCNINLGGNCLLELLKSLKVPYITFDCTSF